MGPANGTAIGSLCVACGLFIAALIITFPDTLPSEPAVARFAIGLFALAAIGAGSMLGFQQAARVATKQVFVWVALFSVGIVGYAFRSDVTQMALSNSLDVLSNLSLPSKDDSKTHREVQLRAGRNGHFEVRALVNGAHINFLVDTGATHVALSPKDARRIGFNPSELNYNRQVSTANGLIYVAPIMIKQIKIGDIVVRNVSGAVIKEGLGDPLLGMSFLGKLSTFSMSREVLVLKQ